MNDTVKKQRENQIDVKPRIDSNAQLIDPIDFSFKDLMNFAEIHDMQPRYAHAEPKKRDGKFVSLSLKLGYNALTEVNGMYDWCSLNFLKPEQLSSLDLSFNCFTIIPNEILKFVGLKCLYLQGNKIADLAEVEKLRSLHNLTTLAVHGNPIENLAGFRFFILSKLPLLKHLNFSGVSKAERENAIVWMKSNRAPLKLQEEKKKQSIKKVKVEED